ncbi:SufE family protein [Leadbetterella byssophila]|uniref:Cysteine desulfuration protein SufE n=1 Tax=Leadbetterella byssophila (strain DSM 17132 / JCM 16389 / KACC 11308 / NBRC 106382 / 4M15) TaxID=649349 RepID=E4RQZ9_LEAB4|nr:SufE family protein [Leadbetterella byssophila]ADQ16594.1 Cysteine desulfuration protein SufE [Leadbetterella byssophila DSM 17132]
MKINEIQDELIETFALFDDWEEKYEYIIDLGKKLPPMDDAHKTEDNIIKGCQSIVWLSAKYEGGKVYFEADSQAIIVKGLVSMLLKVLSGHTPQEILDADLYFINETGLSSHLAQTRSNGLAAMVKQMKTYALAFRSTES